MLKEKTYAAGDDDSEIEAHIVQNPQPDPDVVCSDLKQTKGKRRLCRLLQEFHKNNLNSRIVMKQL
jgi:hypothetical protein